MTIRVGVRYLYLYLYLGTVFRVPVPVPVPDPHEQEVPGTCTWWQITWKNQVQCRYIYVIININIYRILNIHNTDQVSVSLWC